MTNSLIWLFRRCRLGLSAFALLALVSACGSESLNPSSDTTAGDALGADSLAADSLATPLDSIAVPIDSTVPLADSTLTGSADSTLPGDTTGIVTATATAHTGIAFGAFNMQHQYLTTTLNGSMQGLEPAWLMAELALARAKGGRMILKMTGGSDDRVKTNGSFSLDKWKALVYRFKTLALTSYITDGTLMGVYLIDEPHRAARWGKVIPHATVEAMAKYTKTLWPTMTTFVRARPTWLAQTTMTYTYLDAGWFQYEAQYMGNVSTAITSEVAAATRKGLGIVVGLNVLDGGNGSSNIRGTISTKYKMTATEIRNYGTVLLNQTRACAFFNWTHILGGADYFNRTDIKSALSFLSLKAQAHLKTSCRQ